MQRGQYYNHYHYVETIMT